MRIFFTSPEALFSLWAVMIVLACPLFSGDGEEVLPAVKLEY